MASQKIGSWAFLVGVILAVLFAIAVIAMPVAVAGVGGLMTIILVIIGLIIGFMNIHAKHMSDFLIAAIAVAMVGGTAGGLIGLDQFAPPVGSFLMYIVMNIVSIAAAAALIVGLKQIMALAKQQVM